MNNKIIPTVRSCLYRHPQLGPVHVRIVATSRAIRARWRGRELHITIPPHLPAPEFERFIAEYTPRLLEVKPQLRYPIGRIIDAHECDFEIMLGREEQSHDVCSNWNSQKPLRGKQVNYHVLVRPSILDSNFGAELETAINKTLVALATHATRQYVLPRARQLADELGLAVTGWDVRHNRNRLGACSSRGLIILGSRLIFLPYELRDFVILHELTHLTEHNHSARFHDLCNRYCGGREAELKARTDAFRYPIF